MASRGRRGRPVTMTMPRTSAMPPKQAAEFAEADFPALQPLAAANPPVLHAGSNAWRSPLAAKAAAGPPLQCPYPASSTPLERAHTEVASAAAAVAAASGDSAWAEEWVQRLLDAASESETTTADHALASTAAATTTGASARAGGMSTRTLESCGDSGLGVIASGLSKLKLAPPLGYVASSSQTPSAAAAAAAADADRTASRALPPPLGLCVWGNGAAEETSELSTGVFCSSGSRSSIGSSSGPSRTRRGKTCRDDLAVETSLAKSAQWLLGAKGPGGAELEAETRKGGEESGLGVGVDPEDGGTPRSCSSYGSASLSSGLSPFKAGNWSFTSSSSSSSESDCQSNGTLSPKLGAFEGYPEGCGGAGWGLNSMGCSGSSSRKSDVDVDSLSLVSDEELGGAEVEVTVDGSLERRLYSQSNSTALGGGHTRAVLSSSLQSTRADTKQCISKLQRVQPQQLAANAACGSTLQGGRSMPLDGLKRICLPNTALGQQAAAAAAVATAAAEAAAAAAEFAAAAAAAAGVDGGHWAAFLPPVPHPAGPAVPQLASSSPNHYASHQHQHQQQQQQHSHIVSPHALQALTMHPAMAMPPHWLGQVQPSLLGAPPGAFCHPGMGVSANVGCCSMATGVLPPWASSLTLYRARCNKPAARGPGKGGNGTGTGFFMPRVSDVEGDSDTEGVDGCYESSHGNNHSIQGVNRPAPAGSSAYAGGIFLPSEWTY